MWFTLILISTVALHGLASVSAECAECCSSRPVEYCVIHSQPDCRDYRENGYVQSGVYNVTPLEMNTAYEVYCDMTTDGGGWMVFQRRESGDVDFYRDWDEYEAGFGDVSHEHWLGFIPLQRLTNPGYYALRIDLEDWEGEKRFAHYDIFQIDFANDYTLKVLGYKGDAGDAMKYHNGRRFATKDRDIKSCSNETQGAWWYKYCAHTNLNGIYYHDRKERKTGIFWWKWLRKGKENRYPLKKTEMKMRRL